MARPKQRGYRRARERRRLHQQRALSDADNGASRRRRRRLVRVGQLLMAVGVVIMVVHWLGHLGVFGGQPSSLADLLVGYPAAFVVIFIGVVLAGQ